MKKNLVRTAAALGLSVVMVSGMTACGPKESGPTGDPNNPDKPAEITAMMDTIITFENGLQDVCDDYEAKTGIKLTIQKPDHNNYYEKVTLSFASGEPCDVIEMGSTYYPEMADSGALWDMTDAWDASTEPVKSIINEQYVDALKIDLKDGAGPRLFGFPTVAGNGTITYVRKDWLDEAGMAPPTDYTGFLDMLRTFKNRGGGTIPYTAAGLINSETPYDIYLREFYQDANPDFYVDNSGKYVDGFQEDAMKDAMQRMRDAYAEGLIDAEIVTNKTSTCRDKLNAGLVGCMNYWAGMWDAKLEDNTKATDPDAVLYPLPIIKEAEYYIERVPTAMVITNAAQNPEGIFKYFVEYSHDGGEGQLLFTRGVVDKHYTMNEDGTATALGYYEDPTTPVEKSFYAPELSITEWNDPVPLDERVSSSLAAFQKDRKFATVPLTSDVISENLANLQTVKGEVIANVVHGNISADEGMEDYMNRARPYYEAILADLNGTE